MTETWAYIPGFENRYMISTKGRIISVAHKTKSKNGVIKTFENAIRATRSDKDGYRLITLCLHGRKTTHKVHRLVAEVFVPNPHNYPQINHIDEDRSNNSADNLEWCTQKYNNYYSNVIERMVDGSRIPVIALLPDGETKQFKSYHEAGRALNVDPTTISKIANGKRHDCRGIRFRKAKK